MTVEKLIEELMKIEDKSISVVIPFRSAWFDREKVGNVSKIEIEEPVGEDSSKVKIAIIR